MADQDLTPVTSSNVAAVGYDPQFQILTVQFKHGGIYTYDNVSAQVHQELMAANSVGRYLAANIKPNYVATKIG